MDYLILLSKFLEVTWLRFDIQTLTSPIQLEGATMSHLHLFGDIIHLSLGFFWLIGTDASCRGVSICHLDRIT